MSKKGAELVQFNNTHSSPLGEINQCAFSARQRSAFQGTRTFGQYALVLIQDGSGTYDDANGFHRKLSSGDLIVVFPHLAHCYNPLPGTEWVCSWICFKGPLFELWEKRGLLDSRRPIYHLSPVHDWIRKFESVFSVPEAMRSLSPLQDICRLQQLLSEILSGMGSTSHYQDEHEWISRAYRLIESKLIGDSDWSGIAKALGLTQDVFRKRFTKIAGQPPARYRMNRLIDRACAMMQERRLSDFQIAEVLGFVSPYYFSRRFKQVTGLSPRAFRKQLLI